MRQALARAAGIGPFRDGRGRRERPLANSRINAILKLLIGILDEAVRRRDLGHADGVVVRAPSPSDSDSGEERA